MSDERDAPERIWLDRRSGSTHVVLNGWEPPASHFVTEYVRADLLDAIRARVEELEGELARRDKSAEPKARARKPQPQRPAPFTAEELEARIDKICGCAGKYDCDCVSVFGRARSELWYEHNTARAALTPKGER